MNAKEHTLINLFFGVILLKSVGLLSVWAVFWILAANVFDVDHLVRYWFDKKYRNFKGNYMKHHVLHYYTKNQRFLACHTLEFVILLGLLSALHPIIYYLFVGWTIHFMSDLVVYYKHHRKTEKLFEWIASWHAVELYKETTA